MEFKKQEQIVSNREENFDKMYKSPELAPWTISSPPKELTKLFRQKPYQGKALDIGCGEGHYSIYLASKGFDVLGIDFSGQAIKIAKKNAVKNKIQCKFLKLNISNIEQLSNKFDFILEWGLLHLINPKQRPAYFKKISSLLRKNGKYLLVSFSDQSPECEGENIRRSQNGNFVYYSSISELKKLGPYFKFEKIKTIQIGRKERKNILRIIFM